MSTVVLERFAENLLRRRWKTVIVLCGVTALIGAQALLAPVGTSFLQLVVDDQRQYETYNSRAANFGGDSDDVVYVATVEGTELFSAEKLGAIRLAAEELEKEAEVARVYCLPDVRFLPPRPRLSALEVAARSVARKKLGSGDLQLSESQSSLPLCWPRDAQQQLRTFLPDRKRAMMNDENVVGIFLSHDGRAQGMVIELESARQLGVLAQLDLRRKIESVLRSHGLGMNGVYMSGVVIAQAWMYEQMGFALFVITPIGYLVIGLIVYLLFQRLSLVVTAVTIATMASLIAVGTTVALFGEVTLLVAASPLVILVTSTSDVVHLTAAYQRELIHQPDRHRALVAVVRDVGGACFMTSATTFVGFMAMVTSPAPTMRHFAVACAIGTAAALLLAMTLTPIALSLMKPPRVSQRTRPVLLANSGVDRCVGFCRSLSQTRTKTVIVAAILLMALNMLLLGRLDVSADFSDRFPADHPSRLSTDFFNAQMSGSTHVEVYLQGDGKATREPSFQRAMANLEDRLLRQWDVTAVRSPLMFYRSLDRLIGYQSSDGLPDTLPCVENTWRIFKQVDEDAWKRFIHSAGDTVRLFVQLKETDFLESRRVAERIASAARQEFPANIEIDVTGTYPICGKVVERTFASQLRGIVICCVAIWLMMAIWLRSLKASLVAQLANLLPLLCLLGMLVLTRPAIDMDMLILPIIAIAIAADDTIHFLHRYRVEHRKGGTRKLAIERTYQYTGRAILQSTLVLCLGFLPSAISPYLTIWMLGTYLVVTLLLAVLADLILLPALVCLGWIRVEDRRPENS